MQTVLILFGALVIAVLIYMYLSSAWNTRGKDQRGKTVDHDAS